MPPHNYGDGGPLISDCSLYRDAFVDYRNYHEENFVQECKKTEIYDAERYIIDPPKQKKTTDGELKLRKFSEILENGFCFKPHRFQREFLEQVTKSMAESIVGEDWDRVGPRIMEERGWKSTPKATMGVAPRRFGKSGAVAIGAVARAEVIIVDSPTKQCDVQAIFSTGRRASRNLMEYCYKFVIERGLGPRIVKFNEETLWIKGGDIDSKDPPLAKIYSYPANAKRKYICVVIPS